MLTFHSNGRIDGINNSNFLNSIPTLQRRIVSSPISLSGSGDHTHNLTTGVKEIELIFEDASSNSNSNSSTKTRSVGSNNSARPSFLMSKKTLKAIISYIRDKRLY